MPVRKAEPVLDLHTTIEPCYKLIIDIYFIISSLTI